MMPIEESAYTSVYDNELTPYQQNGISRKGISYINVKPTSFERVDWTPRSDKTSKKNFFKWPYCAFGFTFFLAVTAIALATLALKINLEASSIRNMERQLSASDNNSSGIATDFFKKYGNNLTDLNEFCKLLKVEPGWYNAGNCYQYQKTNTSQNWEETRSLCQSVGGDIAHHGISDLNTRSAILNATDLENTHAWIGLRKINQTFVWINGLRATSETIRWAQGEPNNSGGKEDCVIVN